MPPNPEARTKRPPYSTREAEGEESRARVHEPEEGAYSGIQEAEEDVEAYQDSVGSDEPFSAQVLRRMHQDALVLLEEYDEMHSPLEHAPIKEHLKAKLQGLVEEIDGIEALFDQHHPDLPELDGAMGSEEGAEDVTTEPPVEQDSERPEHGEEVSGEEAATAMMTKSFFEKTKALRFKVKGLDTSAEEVKSALEFYRKVKKICSHCGKKNCPCKGMPCTETKEFPGEDPMAGVEREEEVEQQQEPFSELSDYHWDFVRGAHGFLEELAGTPSDAWGEGQRQKAFHFHKSLHSITGDLSEEETPGEEWHDRPPEVRPEHEVTPEGIVAGGEAEEQEEAEGVSPHEVYEPGKTTSEAREELRRKHGTKYMGKDEESRTIKRRRTKKGLEEDDYETKVRGSHRKAGREHYRPMWRASKFLEGASQSPTWEDHHREEAGQHHSSLGEVLTSFGGLDLVHEEMEDVELPSPDSPSVRREDVGDIKDKTNVQGLMKTASDQNRAIKDLLGKLGINGR